MVKEPIWQISALVLPFKLSHEVDDIALGDLSHGEEFPHRRPFLPRRFTPQSSKRLKRRQAYQQLQLNRPQQQQQFMPEWLSDSPTDRRVSSSQPRQAGRTVRETLKAVFEAFRGKNGAILMTHFRLKIQFYIRNDNKKICDFWTSDPSVCRRIAEPFGHELLLLLRPI